MWILRVFDLLHEICALPNEGEGPGSGTLPYIYPHHTVRPSGLRVCLTQSRHG